MVDVVVGGIDGRSGTVTVRRLLLGVCFVCSLSSCFIGVFVSCGVRVV